jgi:hypothetical protein
MTLPSLTVPPPTRRARIEVNHRLHLGVTLDGLQVTYDFDEAAGVVMIRVLRAQPGGKLTETMRRETGAWLLLATVDRDRQSPDDVTVDLSRVEREAPPLVLEALAIFYDADELTPLHRRALRAFYRELTYVTATAKLGA